MDTPQMPHLPRPALVLNAALPMVAGGKIIPQSMWMESQMRAFATEHARQFEQAAASLALELADARAECSRLADLAAAKALPTAAPGQCPMCGEYSMAARAHQGLYGTKIDLG